MNTLRRLFAALWRAIKLDEAAATASAMQVDGYTDFEIAEEVRAIHARRAGAQDKDSQKD